MSYLSDASLVMIPSGVEAGTVFTSKPAGGSADLTFTRSNDTATRVGPNGYIEKVRTNLALYSQDFSQIGTWVPRNGTYTANAGTAPDGTNTATKVTATNIDPYIYQSISFNGVITASCYMKGIGSSIGKNAQVRIGAIPTTIALTSNWQRVSVTTTISGATICGVEVPDPAIIGDEALIWGFQVEAGTVATDYIETTTAAVSVGPVANVPRINFDPVLPRTGYLLWEPQRTNLALYSEQIDNAVWTKDGTTATVNQTASPSGYADADLVTNNGLSGDHTIYQAIGLSATTCTVSAYVKKNTESYVHLTLNLGSNENEWATATFNLDTATSANYANTLSTPSSTITAFGTDGWYRVTMTCTLANTANHILLIGFAKAGAPDTSRGRYVTENTNSFYIWGCQTEEGAYPASYIPTYGAAATRGNDDADTPFASPLTTDGSATIFFHDLGVPDSDVINATSASYRYQASTGNYVSLTTNDTAWRVRVQGGGTANYKGLNDHPKTSPIKVAVIVSSTHYSIFANGVKEVDNESLSSTADFSSIQSFRTNIQEDVGVRKTVQHLVFPTALTDTQAIELTA